jgi:PIN domain nuclease of toxin-antitoxin system
MLHRLGRISEDPELDPFAGALSQVAILPITREVVRCLRKLDVRSDPAGELIAATSLATGIPLVTRDRKLGRRKSFRSLAERNSPGQDQREPQSGFAGGSQRSTAV